jgi:hypothetical protein
MELSVLTYYFFLWVSLDSNQRPKVYETFALKPAELHTLLVFSLPLNNHIARPMLLSDAYQLRGVSGVIITLTFDPNSP